MDWFELLKLVLSIFQLLIVPAFYWILKIEKKVVKIETMIQSCRACRENIGPQKGD